MNIWNLEEENHAKPLVHHKITTIDYIDKKTGSHIGINDNLKRRLHSFYNIQGFKTSREHNIGMTSFIRFLDSTDQFNQILVRENENSLTFLLSKKSKHFMTFSQNFSSSGKIGLSYEFGLRNFLSMLEIVSFKAEKHVEEGNSFDLNINLPFASPDNSANLSAGFATTTLFPEFKVERLTAAFKLNNNKHNHFFSFGVESNRPTFEPLQFRNHAYDNLLKTEHNINISAGKSSSTRSRFFHSINNYMEAKILFYSPKASDLQLNFKNNSKFYLHQLLPFKVLRNQMKYYTMEIDNTTNLFMNNALNHNQNISMIKKHYFSRSRGYHNISSNNPFITHRGTIYNQIAATHSLKLNLKHFPLIQNDNCFPFFHVTNYFNSYNWLQTFSVDSCIGTGLVYKLNERFSLELLYNFIHMNSQKNSLTKTENFQIKVSFDD